MKEIAESSDLIGVMMGMHNDSTFNYSMDFSSKQQRFIKDIDFLEVIVNTLNTEVDGLLSQMELIEKKLEINYDDECKDENKDISVTNN
jgi:hypothetical protein